MDTKGGGVRGGGGLVPADGGWNHLSFAWHHFSPFSAAAVATFFGGAP